jgi:hypothetical protein
MAGQACAGCALSRFLDPMKVHLARGLGRQAMIGSKVAVAGRPRRRSELERQVLQQATALLECEKAACLTAGEGQAEFARSRAILCLGREISIPTAAAGQCEWSRLLVRLGRPLSEISVNKFAEKNGCCHFLSDFQSKTRFSCPTGEAKRSYPRLPVILRQTNSPTDAALDKTTRASTSGASPSLRAICG